MTRLLSFVDAAVGEVESALHFRHTARVFSECSYIELFDGTYKKLQLPPLDERQIYLMGYSMGANVWMKQRVL